MTRFLLVRHADDGLQGERLAGRAAGISLTPSGRKQADCLARRLCREPIAAVYSSPRDRAVETARAIAGAAGLETRSAIELDEIDYGDWTGRRIDELRDCPRWRLFNVTRSCARVPNGELIVEVQARLVALIERLRARYDGTALALVSHADVIRAAVAYYLGIPIDLMLRFEISPASVTTLEITAEGPLLRCINDRETTWS